MFKSKKEVVEYFRDKIANNNGWALRALEVIWSYQVQSEKEEATTKFNNGVGFTSFDAEFLTDLYANLQKYGKLSLKQNESLRKIMPKYANQLVQHCLNVGSLVRVKRGVYEFKKG